MVLICLTLNQLEDYILESAVFDKYEDPFPWSIGATYDHN